MRRRPQSSGTPGRPKPTTRLQSRLRFNRIRELAPEYRASFDGLLRFSDFPSAERTLSTLESLRRQFQTLGDAKGAACCREVALLGRRRSEAIARNPRVKPEVRREKGEVAAWFAVWLESPDIFADWLELRKASAEFQRLAETCGSGRAGEGEGSDVDR